MKGRQVSICLPFLFYTYMTLEQLSSAIENNITSGLRGATVNTAFSKQQIEDGIIQERLQIIKEYSMRNMLPVRDLMVSIPCVKVDCEDIDRCCNSTYPTEKLKHIEIPQVFNDFGSDAIAYIGSTDRQWPYQIYTTDAFKYHQFKRRGGSDPFVWVDTTPNKNNLNDAFIFNAPAMLSELLVVMIPKDPRQLEGYGCCSDAEVSNLTFVDTEIEKRLTEKYIRWYRQMAMPIQPNDQTVES
jgi:hypothetical protein